MSVKIGISPIAWQNDDLPDLTAKFTMQQALEEAREIGYIGVERGQRMPQDTDGLRAYLEAADIALCGGWCSGASLVNALAEEQDAVRAQLEQFIALGSPCMVYAECSNTIQTHAQTPVANRPKLDRDEMRAYAARISELAKWMADQGMPMSYHHHMGSIVESEDDVNWLMDGSAPELHLCFDTGHLLFGGGDVMATLDRWGDRVQHVHFKNIRQPVVDRIRAARGSFLDAVITGAFTVPGDPDGCIDFHAVGGALASMDYSGWIVVEAEQDPAKAPPKEYSQMGYAHIVDVCAAAGLKIDE